MSDEYQWSFNALFYRVADDGSHGDGYPFTVDRTLAHAFYPTSHPLGGDMHFNTRFTFSTVEPPNPGSKYIICIYIYVFYKYLTFITARII